MAFTTDQLEKLETAYASGTLIVRIGDKQITYRSLSEMRATIQDIKKSLGLLSGKARRVYPAFGKGV